MFELRVTTRGPIFDRRADAAAHDAAQAMVDDIAAAGFQSIHTTLQRVLKHPTGHYQSRIRNRALGPMTRVLYDDRVIYGAWLEGIGSRNFPKTAFKGYFTFRRVTRTLDRRAAAIGRRTLRRYIGRMR